MIYNIFYLFIFPQVCVFTQLFTFILLPNPLKAVADNTFPSFLGTHGAVATK